MNFYLTVPLVTFVICFILAVLVLWRAPRGFAQRLFSLFLFSMALFGITLFCMRSSPDFEHALLWEKALLALLLLFSVFFLHFTFAYTGIRPKKRLIPALYLFLLLVFALSPTDLLVSGMDRDRYGFLPI